MLATVQLSILCQVSADTLLPMQLFDLDLADNRLSGTLPSSWAGLTQASHGQASVAMCTCHNE